MEPMDVDLTFNDLLTEFAHAQGELIQRIRVLESMLLNLLHDYYELKWKSSVR